MRFAHPLLFALFVFVAWAGLNSPSPVGLAQDARTGPLQGKLLVATETNRDPRFYHSVIYMVRHTREGAFGLVINKPYGKGPLEKMMKGLGLDPKGASGELNLHYGGPVAVNHLFFLHSSDYVHDKSDDIDGTVSFTKDAKILRAYAAGKGPKRVFVAAGYAGWSAGQLEGEITRGVWKIAPSSEDLVFGDGKKDAWEKLSDAEGIPL